MDLYVVRVKQDIDLYASTQEVEFYFETLEKAQDFIKTVFNNTTDTSIYLYLDEEK